MKTYCGHLGTQYGRMKAVVRVRYGSEAMAALGISRNELNNYWGEIGNASQLYASQLMPNGTILYEWGRGRAWVTKEELDVLMKAFSKE